MDNDDVMAKTTKWKMRLDQCDGVKGVLWASHSFVEVSEKGIRSIERKLVQVKRNKDAVITLTKWEGLVEQDRDILRSFYRTYVLVEKSMSNTMEDIRKMIDLKKEIEGLSLRPLEEEKSCA